MIVKDMRLPFYVPGVDPTSPLYNTNGSEGECGPEREVDFSKRGNCYSSVSLLSWAAKQSELEAGLGWLDDDWRRADHMPVFDVDVEPTEQVQAAVTGMFPHCPIEWVPSTNHHHVYVDTHLSFDNFITRLGSLAAVGIVQPGYVHATDKRGAAFVRKPGVMKVE